MLSSVGAIRGGTAFRFRVTNDPQRTNNCMINLILVDSDDDDDDEDYC